MNLIASRCLFSVSADSTPYCVFRNRSRYDSAHFEIRDPSENPRRLFMQQREEAQKSSKYFQEYISEYPVSSRFLQETIVNDLCSTPSPASDICQSTLCTFSHGRHEMIIHTGGKYMDQLIIRQKAAMMPKGTAINDDLGFSLSLGKGEPIREVHRAGTNERDTTNHQVSRTRSEIFHTKSTDIYDHLTDFDVDQDARPKPSCPIIIEPVRKWQIPAEIISMSVSPQSAIYSSASVLDIEGQLYSWDLEQGVAKHSNVHTLFPRWPSRDSILKALDCAPKVDYTSRDYKLTYVMLGRELLSVDFRENRSNTVVISEGAPFTSVCHHHVAKTNIFLSTSDGNISLIDFRYPKKWIAERSIQGSQHSRFKFSPLNDGDALLLGYGPNGRHMYIHSLDLNSSNLSEKALHRHTTSRFALASEPRVGTGCCWDINAFPVIDRSSHHFSLWGAELVPINHKNMSGSLTDGAQEKRKPCREYLLLQQSSIGDVYAQQISVQYLDDKFRNEEPIIQLGLPLGVTCNPSSNKERTDEQADCPSQSHSAPIDSMTALMRGLVLEKCVFGSIDYQKDSYPVSASTFMPLAGEENARNSKTVSTNLITLNRAFKSGKKRINAINEPALVNNFLNEISHSCLSELQKMPMTLWDVWNYIFCMTKVDVDALQLRHYLRKSSLINEVSISPLTARPVMTCDGMRVSALRPLMVLQENHSSKGEETPSTLCACKVDEKYGPDDELLTKPCNQYHYCTFMHCFIYSHQESDERCRRVPWQGRSADQSDISESIISKLDKEWSI